VVKPLPTRVESAWLVTGRDDDPEYLMLAKLEVDSDGVWWVHQHIGASGERYSKDWPTEAEARAHLQKVYDMGAEHGRWQVRQY
jgi:Mn-containing catalase